MKTQPILYILLLWMLASCSQSHPQVEILFQQAEAVMMERPDSVFRLLDSLHLRQQLNLGETARYAVLLTRAANKTYRSLADSPYDSLMQIAVKQYKGDSKNRAIALLYLGRVRMEQQRWQEAMTYLQESYRLMQRYPEEKEYRRHILSSLSGDYQVLGYDDEAMAATRELLELCDDDTDRSVALSQLGDFYNNKEKLDSALHYQHLAFDLAQKSNEDNLASMYANRIGYIFLSLERYDSALVYLNKSGHPVYLDDRIGEAYYYLGQPDSAVIYLKHYVESPIESKNTEAYRLLYLIEKNRGNLPQAYNHLEQAMLLADSTIATLDRGAEIDSLIMSHHTQLATQAQQAQSREERNWLLMAFITVILLACLCYQYILRKKDRKMKEMMERLLEQDRIIVDSRQQIAEKQESIEGLHQEKQYLQNWLFTQTPIYHKIVELGKQDFSKPKECKVLSFKEQKDLKDSLFSLCSSFVSELRTDFPRLEEDDILLLCLEKYTNFDANTIALCFGTTSKHTVSQRRYRMKERYKKR